MAGGHPAFDLSGKVAVVVGGTSGLGLAITLGLAQAGADVVATARRKNQVESTAVAVEQHGRRTLRILSDVLDRSSLVAARDAILREFGHIDILVNAAGITKRGATLDFSEEDWDRILQVNITGTLRGCQIFGAPMLERGEGRIINIGSLSSYVGLLEVAAYGTSKSAVAGLTRALAVEWSPRGVTVNAIAPGVFRTDLNKNLLDSTERGKEFLLRTPMRRFGQLDEVAGAAIYLASDAASFVNGEIIAVDGGFLASGVNQ